MSRLTRTAILAYQGFMNSPEYYRSSPEGKAPKRCTPTRGANFEVWASLIVSPEGTFESSQAFQRLDRTEAPESRRDGRDNTIGNDAQSAQA
jgi:hypothetical protein